MSPNQHQTSLRGPLTIYSWVHNESAPIALKMGTYRGNYKSYILYNTFVARSYTFFLMIFFLEKYQVPKKIYLLFRERSHRLFCICILITTDISWIRPEENSIFFLIMELCDFEIVWNKKEGKRYKKTPFTNGGREIEKNPLVQL